MSHGMKRRWVWLGILFVSLAVVRSAEAQRSPKADAAFAEGAKHLRAREFDKARGPLETALAEAPDVKYKLRVYNALMQVYRTLSEPDQMIEACEFTVKEGEVLAERSLTASALASFLYQRGKVDSYFKSYSERAAKDPDDYMAMAILPQLGRGMNLASAEVKKLQEQFQSAEKRAAIGFAQGREKQAAASDADKSWLYHEAAAYWSKAAEHKQAVEAARKAEHSGPLKWDFQNYYWHDHLGDVYLAAGEYDAAAQHFAKAIEATTIEGSKKSGEKKLAEAKLKLAEKQK